VILTLGIPAIKPAKSGQGKLLNGRRLIMTRLTIVAAIGVLSATIPLPTAAGSEPAGHRHDAENFSAGEPGDPEKPSRAIKVIMQERDGKMLFAPNHVEIQKGEQIKFELYNSGELDHEFVLATAQENQKHAEAMKISGLTGRTTLSDSRPIHREP
jgi:uncharacterized cupredoxin-like copper-binding protein